MEMFFGIFSMGCGIYCLYSFYMLKFKNQIANKILLPNDIDVKKCKDVEGYCKEAGFPLLLLGAVTTLYGASDIYHTRMGGSDILFLIMMAVLFITLVVFVVLIRKINKKYFGD